MIAQVQYSCLCEEEKMKENRYEESGTRHHEAEREISLTDNVIIPVGRLGHCSNHREKVSVRQNARFKDYPINPISLSM